MAKIVITAEQRAAILAGVAEIDVPEVLPGAPAVQTPAQPPAPTQSPTPQAQAPAAPTPPAPNAIEVLTGQVAQFAEKNATLTVELNTLKASAGDVPRLTKIVADVTGQMQVALGGTATAEALGSKDLLVEYDRIEAVYKTKFPTGGVGARAHSPETKKEPTAYQDAVRDRLSLVSSN